MFTDERRENPLHIISFLAAWTKFEICYFQISYKKKKSDDQEKI